MLKEKVKNYLEKLQNLSQTKKVIIFSVVMGIAFVVMLFFTIKFTQNNIHNIQKSLISTNNQ